MKKFYLVVDDEVKKFYLVVDDEVKKCYLVVDDEVKKCYLVDDELTLFNWKFMDILQLCFTLFLCVTEVQGTLKTFPENFFVENLSKKKFFTKLFKSGKFVFITLTF